MANVRQKAILKFRDYDFVERFGALLQETGKVKVVGIGIFEVKRIKERKGWNVGKGGDIILPSYNKLAFRPAKALKVKLQAYGAK